MNDDANNDTASVQKDSSDRRQPKIDWADPKVPVGNAPPMPRWPLVVLATMWLSWLVFLVVTVLSHPQW